jgi:hypothetical protein
MTHCTCSIPPQVAIVSTMKQSRHDGGGQHRAAAVLRARERRDRAERRSRRWWSVLYGNFNPRRRAPSRRLGDTRFHILDWHSPHLLAVAIGIVLLCVADSFMTLALLQEGAEEVNPIMAALIYRSVAMFAALKMGMTSAGVILMVFLARYRFMRLLRVEWALYGVLLAYLSLVGYEIWILKGPVDLPIL